MAPPGDLDGLSHAELKGLVVKQWEEMVELQRMVAALRATYCAPACAAAWITVDDTGARHKGKNGFCTQIGNAYFT